MFEIKGLDQIVFKMLFVMCDSNKIILFELMNINFFSNFIINKMNQENKSDIINLVLKIVENHESIIITN